MLMHTYYMLIHLSNTHTKTHIHTHTHTSSYTNYPPQYTRIIGSSREEDQQHFSRGLERERKRDRERQREREREIEKKRGIEKEDRMSPLWF